MRSWGISAVIHSLVLAALAASIGAGAQHAEKLHRIGALSPDIPPPGLITAFKEAFHELGYVEGKNFTLELRHAEGRDERLAALAEELVRLNVDVILAVNTAAAQAAKKATASIPIVMTRVADPVKTGLVPRLSRPGGNITGLSFMPDEVSEKRLELLKEALPRAVRVAALWHEPNPAASLIMREMEPLAERLGLRLVQRPVRGPGDFIVAFEAAAADRADAVILVDDAFLTAHRAELGALAAKHALPLISLFQDFAEAGGLIAYGPSTPAMYRRAAYYIDRILKGTAPGDLPVEQPTKFHLVVNLKTATALRLTIPASLLTRADHIIE